MIVIAYRQIYSWIFPHVRLMLARGKGDYQIDYVPAPRITEADKTNDRKYVCVWVYFSFV